MHHTLHHLSTPTRRGAAALAAGALLVGFTGAATAAPAQRGADDLTPRTHFYMKPDGSSGANRSGEGIPNIDSVKATIRTYYDAGSDGIADKQSSPYITEVNKILNDQNAYLAQHTGANKAIVLDTDDTTLWTYDMEDGAMHFNFDPTLQNTWVQEQRFPATPGMVAFVDKAAQLGYTIFGLTGRNDDQKAATLANLTKVGYGTHFTADKFFTKWTGVGASQQPSYITCAAVKCTTVEYKAQTRKHIVQDLGYDIVLNVGDQWSDLLGGYADKELKLPNPTYYLPSPNLPGVSQPYLAPRNRFVMEPDGSSGKTEGGEGIPNIDSVKATIRSYYNAPTGIANTHKSRYITDMKKVRDTWASRLKTRCANQKSYGNKPAVVFDVDDTTLWTYDMEDAAMHFNFDPALQDEWVQDKRFTSVPKMRRVVRAAQNGGCKVVGLTGRSDSQRKATLANLRKYYGDAFRGKWFFTKWDSDAKPPKYIDCKDQTACTRVEFKSQTRAHVEKKFGVKIIANFGDQYSDLIGGHSGSTVKIPNPTYYLP